MIVLSQEELILLLVERRDFLREQGFKAEEAIMWQEYSDIEEWHSCINLEWFYVILEVPVGAFVVYRN